MKPPFAYYGGKTTLAERIRRSGSMPWTLNAYADRLWEAAERIAGVSLECRPALQVIADYGQHDSVLFFKRPVLAASDLHVDHIKPVAHGGSDQLDNLQVAHSWCNLRKGARV